MEDVSIVHNIEDNGLPNIFYHLHSLYSIIHSIYIVFYILQVPVKSLQKAIY